MEEKNEVLLKVGELYNPPKEIIDEAYIKDYESFYKKSIENREKFWEEIANDLFWYQKWDKVLEFNFPFAKWFINAKTNLSYNALDINVEKRPNQIAYIYVDEDLNEIKVTYKELYTLVNKLANGLKSLGLKKGDRVSIYMPNSVEAIAAMLACARIGVIHGVVFAGFSENALHMRISDAGSKALITASYTKRRGKKIDLLQTAINASKNTNVEKIIVWDRDENVQKSDNIIDYYDLVNKQKAYCEPEKLDSEDPLFILYTSGTTGKPKGIVHTQGGYMVGTYFTTKINFDIKPDKDIYWCTADIGWITGHSYIVYGPLVNGVTSIIFEGAPDYPDPATWWKIVEKYQVTKFYTAPTAVRMFMKYGEEWPKKHDLSSLKILGSVGEPINPEAWEWYHKNIGNGKCPIVDTWWQTETGMHIINTIPSYPQKPGKAGKPFFGVEVDIVDKDGNKVPPNTVGFLVIKTPWPSMFRNCWQDPERYKKYWTSIKGNVYNPDDLATIDEDGYIMILGRADDVLSVSGHRIGTMEVESALVDHEAVAEAAVIGKPHQIKGESIKAFIILKLSYSPSKELEESIKKHVREVIGALAVPDEIEFVEKLPKTRSGKIMRRVLRAKELGLDVGDVSTLEE